MICSALRWGLSAVVWASVNATTSKPRAAALRKVVSTQKSVAQPQMSSLYARILSTANNKMVQVASVVRESSRDYPRPVALEIFEYPPFLFEADALQQCLRDMAENPEYADIKFTESSVGTVYLYSTRYLDEDYAAFLAENEDVGAIASP